MQGETQGDIGADGMHDLGRRTLAAAVRNASETRGAAALALGSLNTPRGSGGGEGGGGGSRRDADAGGGRGGGGGAALSFAFSFASAAAAYKELDGGRGVRKEARDGAHNARSASARQKEERRGGGGGEAGGRSTIKVSGPSPWPTP